MKKFVHTFQVVNVAMTERVTEVDEDNCKLTTVIIRLTVKQNCASPATTIFTKLFVIDVAPEDVGIEPAVLVDTSNYVAVDLDKFEKVASFNLASQRGDETELCRFDEYSQSEPIDAE